MKYTVESIQPKLAHFLDTVIEHANFALDYKLEQGRATHPEVENPEVTVEFSGDDVELLLANRAELLLALEHLSMEAMRLPPEDHSLISFDADDYRLLRIEELRMSALAAADKVKRTRVPFHFNPMSSRERRIIHLALRDEKDLRSESLGFGASRAVVVLPADMPTPLAPPPHRPMRRADGGSTPGANRNRRGMRGGDGNRPPRDRGNR